MVFRVDTNNQSAIKIIWCQVEGKEERQTDMEKQVKRQSTSHTVSDLIV